MFKPKTLVTYCSLSDLNVDQNKDSLVRTRPTERFTLFLIQTEVYITLQILMM